ncbi:hypothetical protein MOTT12_01725 [Mycobacterium intracellulare subsp. yongonense]|nr:hypothetical protein MOTT12_01725 [Mycobacterium intracellulare subsp. yongonense]
MTAEQVMPAEIAAGTRTDVGEVMSTSLTPRHSTSKSCSPAPTASAPFS